MGKCWLLTGVKRKVLHVQISLIDCFSFKDDSLLEVNTNHGCILTNKKLKLKKKKNWYFFKILTTYILTNQSQSELFNILKGSY